MTVEIHETTIATDDAGTIVELHISDAPIDDENASFRIELLATLPLYEAPLLLQLQREAIGEAIRVLSEFHNSLLQKFPSTVQARPPVKR